MRMPARIKPLTLAIAGGVIVTFLGFSVLGHFGSFSGTLDKSGAVINPAPNVFTVGQIRMALSTPMPRSIGAVTQAAAGTAFGGAPASLEPRLSVKTRSNIAFPQIGSDRNVAVDRNVPIPNRNVPSRPFSRSSQLVRTGSLNLEIADIDRAVHAASAIVDGELGDIINLDYHSALPTNASQSASMEVRVPQYRFESALDELGALGKVTARSVNAQDVAGQIIDAQARLRNLRHTEADILKIMDRYGDIEQVLRVTQELGGIREQIETLDAQLKGMQYQVAYSTITINFSTPVTAVNPPAGTIILANAWHAALAALEDLTLGVLSFGLWIVAFTPYLLLIALVVVLVMRRNRVRPAAG